MITVFCSSWDNSAVFGPPSCAIMVLFGMRWSRVAFTSSRTLPILSSSFSISSEVSSQEGWFSADRHLLALKKLGHIQSHSPWVHAVTLLGALLPTRNEPKVPPEGGPPGTHVVHGDRSFDCHFVLFGVTAEEIRWQSGVVVPHVTVLFDEADTLGRDASNSTD